jgi:dTDP-4-dehydrorhamnose reductase
VTIIITGAGGQLGTALKKQLSKKTQSRIIALNRNDLDITDEQAVKECFKKYQPRYIINTAAYNAVDEAEIYREHAFRVNFAAVETMAKECRKYSTKMIHFSTDYVFDGKKKTPYQEEDACFPLSVYGKTKLASEEIIKENGIDYLILRISWLFSDVSTNFVRKILAQLKKDAFITVVDDQKGCPTAAESVSEVVTLLINNHPTVNGIFHYSDLPVTNWFDFAKEIQQRLNENNEISTKDIRPIKSTELMTKAPRPHNSVLDCSKIKKLLGIEQADWREKLAFVNETIGILEL